MRYFASLFLCILLCVGCTSKSNKFIIGVSQCSEDIWRDKLNDELRTAGYLNDSIEIKVASSNDDSQKQMQQINQFIDQGVDLLVVSPNELNSVSAALDRAYDKGIPVVLYDRKTNSDKYTAYFGCDNYQIGRTMGLYIAQQLKGKGRVVEIRGLAGSSPSQERHRGFMDAIKDYPSVQLVVSEAGDWKEESGIKAMKRILAKTQDFDYVFAHNDRMAWGAYVAVHQEKINHPYKYTGVDAMSTEGGGLELVRDGVFEASYLYPTQGDEVINLCMRILTHKPFKRENLFSTSIVTKGNAELTLMEAKDAERQKRNLAVLHNQVNQYVADYHAQKLLLVGLLVVLVIISLTVALVYRGYVIKTRLNEQMAKKNDELKRLNEEVVQLTNSRLVFFTNISHELRTPLTLIADPVELLLEDESIKGRSRELLLMVKRNALALQQLVGSILDFRKIQNGKMQLKLNRFNIVDAVSTWTNDFRLTASRKHIDLIYHSEDFAGNPEVVADKEKVARIVFNLLSNALKYTPDGGNIHVSLKSEDNDRFRLDVQDSGKGLDAADAEKVFERFFQAKDSSSGTGIGLALVKSFTELHRGEVFVESKPGEGADFVVIMPCVQEGAIAQEASPELSPNVDELQYVSDAKLQEGKLKQVLSDDTDKPTILVVDDNNDIRHYERTLLESKYFVLEARDGKEGLETAKNEIPDLVVCDVMMPVMDGMEFCAKLKSTVATSHIPVVMLTAKNLDEQRVEGYVQGADSYIVKPFNSKVLMARIDNLLKSRAQLRALFKAEESEAFDGKGGERAAEITDPDKIFMKKLHDVIRKNLGNSNFGVEEAAAEIGLSRVQLYRKVKAMTGSSVVDILRKARLAKARHLLQTTKCSISEVAFEVGFSTPSYFTKCFKEEYGIKPGEVE